MAERYVEERRGGSTLREMLSNYDDLCAIEVIAAVMSRNKSKFLHHKLNIVSTNSESSRIVDSFRKFGRSHNRRNCIYQALSDAPAWCRPCSIEDR